MKLLFSKILWLWFNRYIFCHCLTKPIITRIIVSLVFKNVIIKIYITVNSRLRDTSLLRAPSYYGHLAITDTSLLRTPRYYGHPAIRDTLSIPGETYYKLYCRSSRYCGLSLIRHCGHFVRSPTSIFIVLLSLQRTRWNYFSLNTYNFYFIFTCTLHSFITVNLNYMLE